MWRLQAFRLMRARFWGLAGLLALPVLAGCAYYGGGYGYGDDRYSCSWSYDCDDGYRRHHRHHHHHDDDDDGPDGPPPDPPERHAGDVARPLQDGNPGRGGTGGAERGAAPPSASDPILIPGAGDSRH